MFNYKILDHYIWKHKKERKKIFLKQWNPVESLDSQFNVQIFYSQL